MHDWWEWRKAKFCVKFLKGDSSDAVCFADSTQFLTSEHTTLNLKKHFYSDIDGIIMYFKYTSDFICQAFVVATFS